ncbi:hypothetical protein N7516_007024 [Penicillium verrucosum]|uniref:uncharacterized protein n=1 Tax=Penicillium verrucosum TaxID=60171 RepID=UPI0025455CA4|nr:uncharacterized protein N7516_007024 [Penicillium verrucosum]KAJ5932535.1 hypothetical protein N7516_007024 [Penicillium verrucosum]
MSLSPVLSQVGMYVISLLIDHMGQDEEAPGTDAIKLPRGILNYGISGHAQSEVLWKLPGTLEESSIRISPVALSMREA